MASFKFKLGAVLRLREAARDERRGLLAEALRLEDTLRGRVREFDDRLADMKSQHLQAIGPGAVNVDRLIDTHRYGLVVAAEKAVILKQLAALALETEKRREALTVADGEVRVLEKLRETQRERYLEEEQRQEVKMLDEVGSRHRNAEEAA